MAAAAGGAAAGDGTAAVGGRQGDGRAWARARILAAVATRDRIIKRQGLVLSLATQVINETSTETAVQVLVDATYKVVHCDRVSLFLIEDGRLVCRAAPAGGFTGWHLELGHGVAGKVGLTGEMMNITDAYDCPELFDPTHDRLTNYRTKSILCMPLRDRDGYTIGVLQAINKKGVQPDVPMAFDSIDEQMLAFLLALTAQQLRVCELISEKVKAKLRVDTTLGLVETICRTSDVGQALQALTRATRRTLGCQRTFVFMLEHDVLVCRAMGGCEEPSDNLRFALTDPVVGLSASTGRTLLLDSASHATDLRFLQEHLPVEIGATSSSFGADQHTVDGTGVVSALCCPLCDLQSGQVWGVVLAVNRVITLGETAEVQATKSAGQESQERRRSSTLGYLLRGSYSMAGALGEVELGPFLESDLDQLSALVQLAGQFVQGRNLYESQTRAVRKLEALLALFTEATAALHKRDVKAITSLILDKALKMFECDRCTVFTVDHLNGEFLGYFQAQGGSSGQLQELRVPLQGIAGTVASTGRMLNIRDAWSDARFSNQTDLKTGYRTRTLLCAPLTSSSGKVIAVLQCVNKRRGEYFGPEDERMLESVSALLTDMLQRIVLESTYEAFIQSNDAIDADVKDVFRSYSSAAVPGAHHGGAGQRTFDTLPSLVEEPEVLERLLRWDFDHLHMHTEEPNKLKRYITACFSYFNLLSTFGIGRTPLDNCVQALRGRYSHKAPYHNWVHAFSTLHATFLLLSSRAWAGLLPAEDMLALLIAALGHDIEHPGYTNTFLVNTRHQLAIRYNDLSVLENHHAATTCGILASDPALFERVPAELQVRLRLVIVSAILGTDMAKHQDCIHWLESKTAEVPNLRAAGERLRGDDAIDLAKAVLHSADLVHPALPWRIHRQMSVRVAMEFHCQYQEEQRLGLPSLPFMGKDPSSLAGLAPIQVGFIQFVAAPLWSAMNFGAGEDRLVAAKRNVEQNRRAWQQLAEGKEHPDEPTFENLPPAKGAEPPPTGDDRDTPV